MIFIAEKTQNAIIDAIYSGWLLRPETRQHQRGARVSQVLQNGYRDLLKATDLNIFHSQTALKSYEIN